MNPTKGKGERYIYCPDDGGKCLDLVIKNGWNTFHCENCEIYKGSHTYEQKLITEKKKLDPPVQPSPNGYGTAGRAVPFDNKQQDPPSPTNSDKAMEGREETKMAETKVCKKCGDPKDLEDFPKNKNYKSGYSNECKECKRKYQNENNARKRGEEPGNRTASKKKRNKKNVGSQDLQVEVIPGDENLISSSDYSSMIPEIDNSEIFAQVGRAFVGRIEKRVAEAIMSGLSEPEKTLDSPVKPENDGQA